MLQEGGSFLLEMQMRIRHMPGLHGGKFLGNVLQWNYMAVS